LRERTKALILAGLAALFAGCGGDPGREAYAAGRFAEAHDAFVAAGDDVAPAALVNRAMAGLRAGRLRDAADVLARAIEAGDREVAARATFLRGNVAFAQCELAEKQANTLEAEPFAFDISIRYAQAARDHWREAAMTRDDWPAARRNVERALLKLYTLERKKREAERRRERKTEKEPKPEPVPEPPPEDVTEKTEKDPAVAALGSEQVLALFQRLAEKEKEKRELRRAERAKTMASVEKDW
jgi:hypothetical protein